MKPMSNDIREKIQVNIKNGLDISDLINGIVLRGEDLSGAIIKRFNRVSDNISNCNFSRCVIGTEGEITNLSSTVMKNCNFSNARFVSTTWFRRTDARNCNFNFTFFPYLQYQGADFRDSSFCECIIRIGGRCGMGAIFSESFFRELADGWNITITKCKEK